MSDTEKEFKKGDRVSFLCPFEGKRLEAVIKEGPIGGAVWLYQAGGTLEKTEGYLVRRCKGDKSIRFVSTKLIEVLV